MKHLEPPNKCPACGHQGEDDDGIVFDAYDRCYYPECGVVWWEHWLRLARQKVAELELKVSRLVESTADLDALRADGWAVAVHNDYRQDGQLMTFWGFSRGSQWACGEGRTDSEACVAVIESLDLNSTPPGEEAPKE